LKNLSLKTLQIEEVGIFFKENVGNVSSVLNSGFDLDYIYQTRVVVIAFPQLWVFFKHANILPQKIGKFTLSYWGNKNLFELEMGPFNSHKYRELRALLIDPYNSAYGE
jgi:hypothetical protein